ERGAGAARRRVALPVRAGPGRRLGVGRAVTPGRAADGVVGVALAGALAVALAVRPARARPLVDTQLSRVGLAREDRRALAAGVGEGAGLAGAPAGAVAADAVDAEVGLALLVLDTVLAGAELP